MLYLFVGHIKAKEYLRVTDEELEFLAKCEDKDYFKYQLFALGIVERWQEESRKAIQHWKN